MTGVEALEQVEQAIRFTLDATVTETEYEPPYAGIWLTMADGSRWVVRVERQVEDEGKGETNE